MLYSSIAVARKKCNRIPIFHSGNVVYYSSAAWSWIECSTQTCYEQARTVRLYASMRCSSN